MNEPMMRLERERDGTTSRRFAAADAPGAAPLTVPARTSALRLRWLGATPPARPDPACQHGAMNPYERRHRLAR
jgi:hypothetical protein